MDVSLFWKELARVTDYWKQGSGCGWRRVLPAPPSTFQRILGIGPLFIGTTYIASGQLRMSLYLSEK
eukprot:1138485-Pelagomonas_calceolata.AAC.1